MQHHFLRVDLPGYFRGIEDAVFLGEGIERVRSMIYSLIIVVFFNTSLMCNSQFVSRSKISYIISDIIRVLIQLV